MAGFQIELPLIQSWSCHSCSGCCREHTVEITADEHERIRQQGWSPADGIPTSQPLVIENGLFRKTRTLAHQPDGRCVFLDDKGLCRIHARFGEAAKPLACRIYPYAFHPAGKRLTVSLRFSCPSVVRNRGTPLVRQREELRKLAGLAVPRHALDTSPPRLKSGINLTWDETLAIRQTLDDTIARSESPLSVRLLRALQWIALLDQARLTSVRGDRLAELVTLLASATHDEFPDSSSLESIDPVTRVGAAQFRLLAGQYAREDIQGRRRRGLIDRLHLLRAAWTLSTGRGSLPHLNHRLRTLPFDRLEQSFGPLPPSSDEILTRYLRVKIQGLHFCGRASYDAPLIEGFHALALTIPATLWISRWLAASDDRTLLTVDDVAEALALVDHQHGFSNAFGSFGFRGRVRTLARLGDIPRLIAKYVR